MEDNHYIDEIVSRLKKIDPYLIILFGSYAYGSPDEDSDIDILLVTNDDFMPQSYEERLIYRLSIKKMIRATAKKVPVDILIYTKPMFEKFKEVNSSFAKEILTKGKKLYESDNKRVA